MDWVKLRKGRKTRSFNGRKYSGTNREGMAALYERKEGMKDAEFLKELEKQKPKPHTIQQRMGKPFPVQTGRKAWDKHGNLILNDVFDPVDPKIRVDQRKAEWIGSLRHQSIQQFHFIVLREDPITLRHYFAGSDHFLEMQTKTVLYRSQRYQDRDLILRHLRDDKIRWEVVTNVEVAPS